MDKIDQFLQLLNGGTILLTADHAEAVEAYIVRIQAEGVLDEAVEESDFSILTPTQCYEFAYYEPELKITDRRDEMPYDPKSVDHPDFWSAFGRNGITDWPKRSEMAGEDHDGIELEPYREITGITIHHTMRDDYDAMKSLFGWIARPASQGGKGYPRGQYHYAISREESAPIYQLLDDDVMCWHDHTGRYQTALSVGICGHCGYSRPPEATLWNAARLCWHLLQKHGLTIDDVEGHTDRAQGRTVCPGWYADHDITIPSGVWRRDFDIALQCVADGKEWPGYHA